MYPISIQTKFTKQTIDALKNNAFVAQTMDAAFGQGMAFLQAELEKRDPKVREPLTSVTWQRDIPVKVGGGWVDFTSMFFVDYGTTGPNEYGIIGGETNAIPTMQANLSKDVFKVFNWGNIMKVPYIDMQKLAGIGRSLDEILDKGIKLNWNKALDKNVYLGFHGNYGLLNADSVITAVAASTKEAGGTSWDNATPSEIQADINAGLNATWAASQYDLSGMADWVLIPPAKYAILTAPMTIAGCNSILEYILNNNVAKEQGRSLTILPSRWCIGTTNGGPNGDSSLAGPGTNGTDRMAFYVNNEDKLYMDITVPIQRAMTMPDINDGPSYKTVYLGQFGVVKFAYYQPAYYIDGI